MRDLGIILVCSLVVSEMIRDSIYYRYQSFAYDGKFDRTMTVPTFVVAYNS